MANDPEEKLSMSLDAIIRKKSFGDGRPNGSTQPNRNPRHQHERPQYQPQQQQRGRGEGQHGVPRNQWRPQGGNPGQMFPPGGPIMPNFGFPFGEGPFGGFPNPMMQQMMMQGMPFPAPGMRPMGMDGMGPNFGGHRMRPPQAQRDQQKPPAEAAVPLARLDDASGEVTVSLKHQKIVKVAPNGTMTLDSGGHKGAIMFQALNAVLNIVGLTVTRPAKNDDWSVSDGRTLTRFRDGVTIPGRGPQAAQRGQKIVAAFGGGDPTAAAAATLASNAAAAAAGIVLGRKPDESLQKRGSARFQPAQHPRVQPRQSVGPRADGHEAEGPGDAVAQNHDQGQNGVGATVKGSQGQWDADKIRRQKAKGRYRPY